MVGHGANLPEHFGDPLGVSRLRGLILGYDLHKSGDGRRFEQLVQRDACAQYSRQTEYQLDAKKRVAAKLEEVVVNPDRMNAEKLLPHRDDRALDVATRHGVFR